MGEISIFKNKQLILFLIASAFLGITQSIDSSVFNNFLNDTFHLTVSQRTILEIPRELPGFLVVFVSGLLMFLGDIRIAMVANIFAAVGMMFLGFFSTTFGVMMIWMTIYSMGIHLFMPVSNSIGMTLADKKSMGKTLGAINGVNTAAFLATSLITAFIFSLVKVDYSVAFAVGGLASLGSAILIFKMAPNKKITKTKKLFVKKEFKIFYVLSIVNGARKQVFVTFGPWVLIKIFNQGVSTFALLGFITAFAGMLFKPYVGTLIDARGERFVLAAEALLLIMVCSGYALAETIGGGTKITNIALYITCACFIIDQLLTAAGMARATYVRKIAKNPEDISPTLSMGISMDHAVAMFIPLAGSLVWNAFGYQAVFVAGAFIALLNFAITRKIPAQI